MKKLTFLLLPLSLFAGALTLRNDTPYTLDATIISEEGNKLSSLTIEPKDVFTWEDPYGGNQAGKTNAPYTVIWTCPGGAEYGVSYNIGAGATTTAQGSAGARYCRNPNPPAGP